MRLDAYEVSLKKQFILKQMSNYGITHIDGQAVDELDYEHLKRYLAIQRCKNINTESDYNAWF